MRKTIYLWLCLFIGLITTVSVSAQTTWTLFDNGAVDQSVSDFTTKNPSEVAPWGYYYYTIASSSYEKFPSYGNKSFNGCWNADANWFYIAKTGEMHMDGLVRRPAACFIAPADGYYKADVKVARLPYNNNTWTGGRAQVWAYFNYVSPTMNSSMKFDLEVATDNIYNSNGKGAEGNAAYFSDKMQTMYVYLKKGEMMTFEVGSSSIGSGNGSTVWKLLQVSETDEATAKAADKFFTANILASAEQVAQLSGLIDPAKLIKSYMDYEGGLTTTNESGKYNQKDYDRLGSYIDRAEAIVAESPITANEVEVSSLISKLSANSLQEFETGFNHPTMVPAQGWYRLKAKKNNNYLSSNSTFADADLKYNGSQYCYLISSSDVNTRLMLYTFDELKTGAKTTIGAYGNGGHFQLYDCGTKGIYMKSGGNNSQKWVAIKSDDNTIISETNTPDYLNNLLFFELIPVSEEEIRVASVGDGEYSLSFNGTSKDGTYAVKDGKITVSDVEYQLMSYNGINYSIGDDKVAILDQNLVAVPYKVNKTNPNNAAPFPGFRLTPVVEPTATEVSVSSLTNFASGDLSGKKVKVTGTVDFQNLETAGATDLSLIDNQPFHAYKASTLSSALKYTRVFNASATGAYSTKEAPKWQTICLPFDVEKVDAMCPVTYTGGGAEVNWTAGVREDLSSTADYWLYELTGTGFVRTTTGIKANVPYIIAFPYSWINDGETGSYAPKLNVSGDVIFSGKAVATTESQLNEGNEFGIVNNFAQIAAGENVYVLDADGKYFEKGVASANPFRPYAVLPNVSTGESPARLYLFEEGSSLTGLSEISSMKEKVSVISVPGGVQVISENAHAVIICNVNGAELGRINVSEGTQKITLPIGIFIVDGVKVIVNE